LSQLPYKDVLGLRDWRPQEIEAVLQNASSFREVLSRQIKKVPALRGKSIGMLFYEPSTRTRASFELAAKMMSADAIHLSAASSSVVKGESLKDTVLTLQALGMDLLVIRHPMSGAAGFAARQVQIPVINAGDGAHEHPTQGLLDVFTLREACGSLQGLRVLIVGDIAHSRVARSDLHGLTAMGAEVTVCGPATLIPVGLEQLGVAVCEDLDCAIRGAQVVIALRIQLERQERGLFPSLREYSERFGVTAQRLDRAAPGVTVMHPGPINRGLEIAPDVADAGYTLICNQVTNGVAVRMALLFMLMGGRD
jgi:aspartate carbamoyltransferase catalytic subunit